MTVVLVVFARWEPLRCLYAALQSVGITSGCYLFNAAPYVLMLLLMLATSSPDRALAGTPQELGARK
jgi:general nucleoside transport system permease protein